MQLSPERVLTSLFEQAVNVASPAGNMAAYLPQDTTGKAYVIGAGKAAASMAAELEQIWQGDLTGLVVTRYGHTHTRTPCQKIEVIEAAHPVPDLAGQEVGQRILTMVQNLTEQDTVICLISGGGSSLLSMPAGDISLAEKQAINKALLKSGAAIDEMNCVRKHLSAIKGGRLAQVIYPAKLITLSISDVPGDDASVIASGPTVADSSTRFDAIDILQRYKIAIPASVAQWLDSDAAETVKPGDNCFSNSEYHLIATPHSALQSAADLAHTLGITPYILSDEIEGEAREVAKVHAAIAKFCRRDNQPFATPCVILSGGETTVTVKGDGRGGRNCEFLLSLYQELQGEDNIYALACDTDGIDGVEDNAGALFTPQDFTRAQQLGIYAQPYLDNNDSYHFFARLDRLLITGPTLTNVNDFRAILIL